MIFARGLFQIITQLIPELLKGLLPLINYLILIICGRVNINTGRARPQIFYWLTNSGMGLATFNPAISTQPGYEMANIIVKGNCGL